MSSNLLTTVTHRAMATEFAVILPAGDGQAADAALEALELLDEIEASLTIYRESSEISEVNRSAAIRPVEISEPTFQLLRRSIQWSAWTDGAFDVTAGPLVKAWGFTNRRGQKPSDEQIVEARKHVGYGNIVLNEQQLSVKFAKPGVSINLGAIGKGDALDRLAARLRDCGVKDFLIHGGQSSVLASGDQDSSQSRGWRVGIAHPTRPKRRLQGIWLKDAALATSGSGKQFFHHQGRRFGHVIDPRTGYPAGDLLSLTVISESAADADACATGLFVMGLEKIVSWRNRMTDAGLPVGPMYAARPGQRQDSVVPEVFGEFDWVEKE